MQDARSHGCVLDRSVLFYSQTCIPAVVLPISLRVTSVDATAGGEGVDALDAVNGASSTLFIYLSLSSHANNIPYTSFSSLPDTEYKMIWSGPR